MSRKLSNVRIGPASPLALIALFAALGGVSYAAGTIGTADLQNGAVTQPKLAKNAVATGKIRGGAVTRQKVRNGAINTAKIADDAVTGDKVDESTLGQVPSAAKADSATNADSAASVGPNGVDTQAIQGGAVTAPKLAAVVARTKVVTVNAETTLFDFVTCQAGEQMLTGGAQWSGSFNATTAANLHLVYSTPRLTNGWQVRAFNGNAADRNITLRVLCLTG